VLGRPERPREQGLHHLRQVTLLSSSLPALSLNAHASLPKFPYIGGAAQIGGYGSAQCGTCWALTYNGRTINVLAIDHTDAGFNIGLNAMNALTNNQATFLGRVNASYKQVAASVCGITN
jgi:hypothetical protein